MGTERLLGYDYEGWVIDLESQKWVRFAEEALAGTFVDVNENGYPWVTVPEVHKKDTFYWPTKRYGAYHFGSGTYADAHPERYDDAWRWDVEEVARYLVQNYDCWVNTYLDHPPGWYLDAVSLDIWGPGGRGDPVNESGTQGFWDIFNNGEPPWIRWCLIDGYIWDDYYGWREYWDTDPYSDAGHWAHRHITTF